MPTDPSTVSESDASADSTAPSSISGAGHQPAPPTVEPLSDTEPKTEWPDDTNHDLIERLVVEGPGKESNLVIMPNASFRYKNQAYDLLVGFQAKGRMHVWKLHREVVYPRCYAIMFHGKQDLRRRYAQGLSKYSTAPVVIVVVVPNTWAPLDTKHLHHMFSFMYWDPAPKIPILPNFLLQDVLTAIKLGRWLNDTLFRSYERAMGAFLNERLTAWLEACPEAPEGLACSSEDVACVFVRLASKPWYRDMAFGACIEELRELLQRKKHLLLRDSAWARLVDKYSELGVFMGQDLIEF